MTGTALCQCGSPRNPVELAAPNLTWRSIQANDALALRHLHSRIETADQVGFRTSLEECVEKIERWLASDARTLCAIDEQERMVAYAAVQSEPSGQPPAIMLEGGIDPDERGHGCGSAVMHWQISASEQIATKLGVAVQVEVTVDDAHETSTDLLIRHGFQPSSWFYELRRKLDSVPEVELSPQGVSFIPYSPEFSENVLVVRNAALGSFQGAISREEWQEDLQYVVPNWSWLAFDKTNDRSPIVGYLLASKYSQDWASLGWREAYVDQLAVHPDWRNQGIATNLLARAIETHLEAGLDYTALGVDTRTESTTFGLFTPLGFERDRHAIQYRATIDPL